MARLNNNNAPLAPFLKRTPESFIGAELQAQVGKGSQEAPKAAGGAPKAAGGSVRPDVLRIEVGPYSVERPREGIANVKAYETKTRHRMSDRASFGDDLKLVAPKHAREIDSLVNRLNNQARTAEEAGSMVEDTITSLPLDIQSQAGDVFLNHEPKISATYSR